MLWRPITRVKRIGDVTYPPDTSSNYSIIFYQDYLYLNMTEIRGDLIFLITIFIFYPFKIIMFHFSVAPISPPRQQKRDSEESLIQ